MPLVVFVRGLNVGGHRTFRPSALAEQLRHLGAVNVGAAGTFVIRRPVSQARLRGEVARRLPFEAEIMVCPGRDIAGLMSGNWFAGQPLRPDVVRFVSILARRPRSATPIPMVFPAGGEWLVKVLALDRRYVEGEYRRQMKAIAGLGKLDEVFGVPATTRNWNTMTAVAKVLETGAA